jgi:hypothetical protein
MDFLLIRGEVCRELLIKDNFPLHGTMISTKTTALMAAMAVLGTVAPAAFAQDYSYNEAYISDVDQSNTNDFTIDQDQVAIAEAETGDWSEGDATAAISQDQGFCIQVNNANQVAGRDADSDQDNEISAEAEAEAFAAIVSEADADADASVDCS